MYKDAHLASLNSLYNCAASSEAGEFYLLSGEEADTSGAEADAFRPIRKKTHLIRKKKPAFPTEKANE